MGKMEQTLKSEITRLAKKQVRATCLPLARDGFWEYERARPGGRNREALVALRKPERRGRKHQAGGGLRKRRR